MIRIMFVNIFWKYFRIYIKYHKSQILILLCLLIVQSGLEAFGIAMFLPILADLTNEQGSSKFNQFVLDHVGFEPSVAHWVMLAGVALVLKAIVSFVQRSWVSHVVAYTNVKMKMEFYTLIESLDYKYLTSIETGDLLNLIVKETGRYSSALKQLSQCVVCVTHLSVCLLVASLINVEAVVLFGVVSIVLLYPLKKLTRMVRSNSIEHTKNSNQLFGDYVQYVHNIKYIKTGSHFAPIKKILDTVSLRQYRILLKQSIYSSVPDIVREPFALLVLALFLLVFVVYLDHPFSVVVVVVLLIYKALNLVFQLQTNWNLFISYTGSVDNVVQMRDEFNKKKVFDQSGEEVNLLNELELKNVTYKHSVKAGIFDVSVKIQKNDIVGIVGSSGAGKTTLFDVLIGLLKPQSGVVMVDGKPYDEINLYQFRKGIGYITQEPVVFHDTVENNISMWDTSVSSHERMKRIAEAAELAGCGDFINEMAQQYQTIIGDKGVNLSGGQRQRLAIARELYREPDILIMDEATSSLDSASEQKIRNSVQSMKGKYTIVIIAHRLSSLLDCDKIIVLDQGKVVEFGSLNELKSDPESSFNHLFQDQFIND